MYPSSEEGHEQGSIDDEEGSYSEVSILALSSLDVVTGGVAGGIEHTISKKQCTGKRIPNNPLSHAPEYLHHASKEDKHRTVN